MKTGPLTFDRLRALLDYDPDTGKFTHRVNPGNGIQAGAEAGYSDRVGYRILRIDRLNYQGHRIAWLYMTGEWPKALIDHINRDPSDNRWANLRDVTASGNQFNRSISPKNKSGVKGVRFNARDRLWYTRIGRRDVGAFKEFSEAVSARKAAEEQAYKEAYK